MSDFSDEAKVFLLKQIAKKNVLYDPTHPDHRSINIRSEIWEEIGNMLDKSPEACKGEWKKLKDSWDRYEKSTAKRTTANDQFFKHMGFLERVKQQDNPQKSIENNRESDLNNSGQQYVQSSSVQVQVVNVVNYEGTSVPICKPNSPLGGPKPATEHRKEIEEGSKNKTKTPQKKNKENAQKTSTNKKKEIIDKKTSATPIRASLNTKAELDDYCSKVRNKLGSLPIDLRENAKEYIDQKLSDLMETALSRGPTGNATE